MIDDIEAWGLFCETVADDTKPTPREIGDFARRLIEQHLPAPTDFTEAEIELWDNDGRILAVGRGRVNRGGLQKTEIRPVRRGVGRVLRVILYGSIVVDGLVDPPGAVDPMSPAMLTVSMEPLFRKPPARVAPGGL